MNRLTVSVIICTRNRADCLEATLRNVAEAVESCVQSVELVVVNNGSTDRTARVCDGFAERKDYVVVCTEARRGKGYAYNTAIATARGRILLFTDDDVRVPRDWIPRMVAAIGEEAPCAVAGGVALPPSLDRPWFTPLHRMWLASTETADAEAPAFLVGANMAMTRAVFDRVAGFDPELGPGALGYCDETLLSLQLREAGIPIRGALDVTVEHHIDPERTSRNAFLDRARGEGRSLAYIAYHWEQRPIQRARLKLMKRLVIRRVRRDRWGQDANVVTEGELCLERDISFLRQYLVERRRPPNYSRCGLKKIRGAM